MARQPSGHHAIIFAATRRGANPGSEGIVGGLFPVDDGGSDGERHGHRPPEEEVIRARTPGHCRNRVKVLEEVIDANDDGEDEHHERDGVMPASPREILADGRLSLKCLSFTCLGAALLTASFDLSLVAALSATPRRTHDP